MTQWPMVPDDGGERWFALSANAALQDWDANTPKRFMCEDDGWFVDDSTPIVDNHAYKIFYANVSWAEAKAACDGVIPGGPSHLAVIDSTRVENLFDTRILLDAWVGGAIDCQLRRVNGPLGTAQCDEPHPYICEIN
jgi:hypothetical protein